MGTRRHQLDYTSSSDQSCDTVIYVGSDGCPISDHDLTDCERPPPSMSTGALSSRSSDGRTSSEQDAGGNGSLARVRGKTAAAYWSGIPRAVGGRHSDGELATSGRPVRGSSFSKKSAWRLPPPPPVPKNRGEMWIDGPKSMTTRVEQWVDGPPEFRHADDNKDDVEMTSASVEQRPPATVDCASFVAEITEEADRHSPVDVPIARADHAFHVGARPDETKHEKILQSAPRTERSEIDLSDSKCATKLSDRQLTVADVHRSASRDSEATDTSTTTEIHTAPDLKIDENHRSSSKNSDDQLSVERRTGYGRSKLDIDALLLANRESIYELQMDEELDGSRESLLQLVCGSDDDWSTCGTEPRRSKCHESDSFTDVDACLKDLDDMTVTMFELPVANEKSNDAERRVDKQQPNEKESTETDIASQVVQQNVWIRTRDINEPATNCAESECPDRSLADVQSTSVSSKTESAAVTTPIANRTRQSALPMPVSSSPNRMRRKPPPVPVRSSSVSQSADRSTNGRTTSTNIVVAPTPTTSSSGVIHQQTLPDSKNGSGSRGFCSRDFSAEREAAATTSVNPPSHGNSGVTVTASSVAEDAKQPASKSRSRIALPCRRDKKPKHQPETSASSLSPAGRTASPAPVAQSRCPAAASRDELRATAVSPLMSPYHAVTKPRSSTGPGSDNNSSVLSGERAVGAGWFQATAAPAAGARRRGGSVRGTRSEMEASSGYESMMRDSEEVTGTSSASECQSPLRLKANKMFRKKGSIIRT